MFTLFLCASKIKAQTEVHFSQYWNVRGYYNPAHAGQTDKLNVDAAYAMQFVGFKNNPRSMYVGADMPFTLFNKRQGVGAGFFTDAIGLFKTQRMWLQYSYKVRIRKARLGLGLQVGLLNETFDPTKLDLGDGDTGSDPAFPTTSSSGNALDAGFGACYTAPKYYIYLSGQHLTSPTVEFSTDDNGEKSEISLDPSLYLAAGYNIQTRNPLISIQPSVFAQTDMSSVRVDMTARVVYKYQEKRFDGGLTYSPGTSVTVSLGATVKSVRLGYSYEIYTSQIGLGNGSHELTVGYSTDINLFGKGKNLHKSVRIL